MNFSSQDSGKKHLGDFNACPEAMGAIVTEQKRESGKSSQSVEMNWDPITRIVGSLGIFTKIDFGKRRVAECHSRSSIFRGYSIFMMAKDLRDAEHREHYPWGDFKDSEGESL